VAADVEAVAGTKRGREDDAEETEREVKRVDTKEVEVQS
jgi:hypothetical protein